MPAELLWSPQALEDLMDIYVTIGLDNADAAERVYAARLVPACCLSFHAWVHDGRRLRRLHAW